MKQKQYILPSLIIEVTAVLLASMIAFQVCNMLGIRMSLLPFIMAAGYVILKLLYHPCIIVARYIIEAIPSSRLSLANELTGEESSAMASSPTKNVRMFKKSGWSCFIMNTSVSNNNINSKKRKRMMKSLMPF